MTARFRTAVPFALALGFAALGLARPAAAQEISLAPAPAAAVSPTSMSAEPASGPTFTSASVAVRHAETPVTAPVPRHGGYGQPIALMVVGGAALLTGLIIGKGAGTAIAVGGAVVGLVGLYQYLQ